MRKIIFILLIFSTIFSNCLYASNRDVWRLIGRHIVFPDKMSVLSKAGIDKTQSLSVNGLCLVSYYGHSSCTSCALQSLSVLKQLADECGVTFIPIIYPDDIYSICSTLSELNISFPVYYDEKDAFIVLNRLNVKASNRTFLLDKSGRIVVVGDPIGQKKIEELYIKRSKEL